MFEHCWVDAQTGFAVNIKSANQDGAAPWSQTTNVTFRSNLVRHAAGAVTIVGRDPHTEGLTRRVTIVNNVFDDINSATWRGSGDFLLVVSSRAPAGGTSSGPAALVVNHNTSLQNRGTIEVDGPPTPGFSFTDNITGGRGYGVKGGGSSTGIPTLERYFPGIPVCPQCARRRASRALSAGQLLPADLGRRGIRRPRRRRLPPGARRALSPDGVRAEPTSAPTSTPSRPR